MRITAQLTHIPNDTFTFAPWIEQQVGGLGIEALFSDTEQINKDVLSGTGADLCKVSFNILPQVLDEYIVLPVGAAIVKGAGPKIVAREHFLKSEISQKKLAVPGLNTTAYLLTCGLLPRFEIVEEVLYNQIIGRVKDGSFHCGLLIHESSFVVEEAGLIEVFNLGDLWAERTKGLPLPLGGLIAKRSLGHEKLSLITESIRASLDTSYKNYQETLQFVLEKSQNKSLPVVEKSIQFWVNDETRQLSSEGKESIEFLMSLSTNKKTVQNNIFFK